MNMTRLIHSLLLFMLPLTPAVSAENFSIDTYLRMQGASEISVSPDGQFVAYSLYERDLERDQGHKLSLDDPSCWRTANPYDRE
jgi:hypothetical protein